MCRQGGRTMPDPCMMEDKPEVRANPSFGQQIPANPSFEQPHQHSTLQCRDPHPGQAAVPRLGGLWGVTTKCTPIPAAAPSHLPRQGTWALQADAPVIPSTTALIISALLQVAGETWAPARRPGTSEGAMGNARWPYTGRDDAPTSSPFPLFKQAMNVRGRQHCGHMVGQGSGFPQERFTTLLPTSWEKAGDMKRDDIWCHCKAWTWMRLQPKLLHPCPCQAMQGWAF